MSGVSAETVAWIAAAGTAAGALIGSAAGGIVGFTLERARERRRAFAGARLVRLDLSLTASALRDAEHDAKWWVFRDVDPMRRGRSTPRP
jgi:ABC-type transport system involved in cytochrome c biogenesis permease subunit